MRAGPVSPCVQGESILGTCAYSGTPASSARRRAPTKLDRCAPSSEERGQLVVDLARWLALGPHS
eukprot:scaffold4707_cov117-Isochrysis_galbana.AAC.5